MSGKTPKWMDPSKIHSLTFHCAATPEGRAVSADTISKWDIEKFGQISYHWVVLLDGTKVRTLRDDQLGAHTGGRNTGNIGICYVGGVASDNKTVKDTRTPAQKKAMGELVDYYVARYPKINVVGHRDWSPDKNGNGIIEPHEWLKGCPSFDVKAWLKERGGVSQFPRYRVTATTLNVRSAANATAAVVDKLSTGDVVTVSGISGDWSLIDGGWVATRYLALIR